MPTVSLKEAKPLSSTNHSPHFISVYLFFPQRIQKSKWRPFSHDLASLSPPRPLLSSLWNDHNMLFGFLIWLGPMCICLGGIRPGRPRADQMEPDGAEVQRVQLSPRHAQTPVWIWIWRILIHFILLMNKRNTIMRQNPESYTVKLYTFFALHI